MQRAGGEASDIAQPARQVVEQLLVTLALVEWRERMDLAEPWQGYGVHLGRRVQLHRARAERDHRSRERQVLGLQAIHVSQELALAAVAVEGRVLQVGGRPGEGGQCWRLLVDRQLQGAAAEYREQVLEVLDLHRLV